MLYFESSSACYKNCLKIDFSFNLFLQELRLKEQTNKIEDKKPHQSTGKTVGPWSSKLSKSLQSIGNEKVLKVIIHVHFDLRILFITTIFLPIILPVCFCVCQISLHYWDIVYHVLNSPYVIKLHWAGGREEEGRKRGREGGRDQE